VSDHHYKLKYSIDTEVGAFTREELDRINSVPGADFGGADALLFASILFPEDGSLSVQFMGYDGRRAEGGPLDGADLFRVWAMLTLEVSQAADLPEPQREFARDVHESIRQAVLRARRRDGQA
jgi:hypothetical protein